MGNSTKKTEIVMVHGFRGNHEGLLWLAKELAKILSANGVVANGLLERVSRQGISKSESGFEDKYSSGDINASHLSRSTRSGLPISSINDEYPSSEIKIEELQGKYTGVRIKYPGGDILVPDIPPFCRAGIPEPTVGVTDDESKNIKGAANGGRGRAFDGVIKKINNKRKTSQKSEQYTPDYYANFVKNFIQAQGLNQPVLIGHSMGSLVVSAAVGKYAELVNEKVILLAPISQKTNKFFTHLQPLAVVLPNRTVGYITTRFLCVPNWREMEKATRQEILDLTYRGGEQYISRQAVRWAAKFSTGYEVGDFLQGKTKEILLLAGEKDRLIPRWQTEAVAQMLCKRGLECQVEFVEGTGHLLNYEDASTVAQRIADFLRPQQRNNES